MSNDHLSKHKLFKKCSIIAGIAILSFALIDNRDMAHIILADILQSDVSPVAEISAAAPADDAPVASPQADPLSESAVQTSTPTETPPETPSDTTIAASMATHAISVEIPTPPVDATPIINTSVQNSVPPLTSATEDPPKKQEPNIPFVDLVNHEATEEKDIVIDQSAPQSCTAEAFTIEIGAGHSQVIPLLLQGAKSRDYTVKIGDVPQGTIFTFMANGLTEITGVSFDNLIISVDVEQDAQKGSFNVPIVYSVTSDGKISNTICQLNVIIQ